MSNLNKAISWFCRLGFHRWSQWDEPQPFGHTMFQRHCCLRCGRIADRQAGWAIEGVNYRLIREE